jgi:hypothetical protein
MSRFTRLFATAAAGLLGGAILCVPLSAPAADHGDAPNVAGDQAGDLADVFVFVDPNDATKLVIVGTFRGFIVPAEAVNFAVFDHTTTYRFEIENTGDAKADQTIDVNFSPKIVTADAASSDPQTATVTLSGRPRRTFTAPTTVSNLSDTPPTSTITNDTATGVSFFAGEVDDPFFFDIPAFARFVASVRNGSPDPTQFNRARDSFSGYNALCIALSVPIADVRGAADNNTVGVGFVALRKTQRFGKTGVITAGGKGKQLDRIATPAVNVALVPFARKNEYNAATPVEGARNTFAADIVATLQALGANDAAIATLAGVAVTNGDYVRVNVTTANTGPGGGDNAGAGFPNGRRLKDDTIDTILTIIANGTALGDNVDANDVPLLDTFPFVAPPQQPRTTGVVDDNTRN